MFLDHLRDLQLQIRFCKRIISRVKGTPTLMIRLITGDHATYERLIADRALHFLGRVFRIVESKPPTPVPVPCGKCGAFDHRTEECKKPLTCNKCQGNHPTSACTSPLPARCVSCNSDEHAAWSMKCPKRPTAPIQGIPNVKVRCLNKRTAEVSGSVAAKSRIHAPITKHDYIINKYKHQMNNASNANREELIIKLRKRIIDDFDVDTSVVFFGNHMYILMIDMLSPDRSSPTEPFDQLRQTITNTGPST
uniref:Pre-C2HC domain-containing protein n=1 Tax=Dendroctonus ponderosae TaxID=77166 RepID=A0AAR5PHC2_DENPD